MSDRLQSRLERLEVLYSEQDYTIQSLNNMIAQQDREIAQLNLHIEQFRLRLQALTSEHPADIDTGFEQPPHY
ncbi:MAG: SlyX family protein [Gammaproteobacteria bacterium]|nr:SlyX family protein [Gammaproteobacteria bacterium]